MNLVIQGELSEPPTESLAFRDVTYEAKKTFDFVLLETQTEFKDIYWKFLLKRGMFDFIDDIITQPEVKNTLRIVYEDTPNVILNYPIIKTKEISILNYIQLCSFFNEFNKN